MVIWTDFVDLFRAAIFAYSQACGGNLGAGIMAVTLLVRMVMLPLTLRLARASAAHRELLQKLQPELEKLRQRYKNDPQRLVEQTRRLYQREGSSPISLTGCLGNLAQMPLMLALFSAVRSCVQAGGRFFWIGNIAKPDLLLAAAVGGLSGLAAAMGASSGEQNQPWMVVVPTFLTLFVLIKMSAGVGLYWGASSLVNLLQAAILRRERLAVKSPN